VVPIESPAQLLTDEGRLEEAEAVARSSVSSLRKSGHQVLLVDSLITYGIALARLGRKEQAQFTFQNAIELAHEADALNKAGTLASIIESRHPELLKQRTTLNRTIDI